MLRSVMAILSMCCLLSHQISPCHIVHRYHLLSVMLPEAITPPNFAHNSNLDEKFVLHKICFMVIRSLQIFAHAMKPQLLYSEQKLW